MAFSAALTARPRVTLRTSTQRRVPALSRASVKVVAHCQVPCGIFDDKRQLMKLKEDCATIRKACAEMADLEGKDGLDVSNTFTRWVMYKEKHADSIIEEVGYYFMCQRFPKYEFASNGDYLAALELHHKLMIAAVKAKQGTSAAACDALDAAIDAITELPMYA